MDSTIEHAVGIRPDLSGLFGRCQNHKVASCSASPRRCFGPSSRIRRTRLGITRSTSSPARQPSATVAASMPSMGQSCVAILSLGATIQANVMTPKAVVGDLAASAIEVQGW